MAKQIAEVIVGIIKYEQTIKIIKEINIWFWF